MIVCDMCSELNDDLVDYLCPRCSDAMVRACDRKKGSDEFINKEWYDRHKARSIQYQKLLGNFFKARLN